MYALLYDHALGTDIAGRSWCFRQGKRGCLFSGLDPQFSINCVTLASVLYVSINLVNVVVSIYH